MTLDPLIGVVEVSELVLCLLFAQAGAKDDVQVSYGELLTILAELVQELFGWAGLGAG